MATYARALVFDLELTALYAFADNDLSSKSSAALTAARRGIRSGACRTE